TKNTQIVINKNKNEKPSTETNTIINFSNYRFGDKSVCEGVLRFWRYKNPNTKLIAIERLNNLQSMELDAALHLRHLVDEVQYVEKGSVSKWNNYLIIDNLFWKSPSLIKSYGPSWEPKLDWVTQDVGQKLCRKYSIPKDFIIFQPLIDAEYNKWRNFNRHHVRKLIAALSEDFTVVCVGTKDTRSNFTNSSSNAIDRK